MGMSRKTIILQGINIWKEYITGKDISLQVLKGVDIEVRKGEFVVVVGPSGSGKSTLLHILGGLDRPTSGTIQFYEKEFSRLTDEQLASFRNQSIGFVFQFHHLLPEFSAIENVAMPALISGRTLYEVKNRAELLLSRVGLTNRMHHMPNELSGGEQQRVAVARALMNNPALVLADEPSGNLDEEQSMKLHELLMTLCTELGVTFLIATHNMDLTRRAHRVLRLADGKLNPMHYH
ncbi:MAG TPA: ABC transporter ATP-binding protein [Bacteroidota bacterium]|jgi:lipoprotein-releasing system ATP-binding protein|nr:ABC transporter ATP-binding protein [Bacteroidota bacterium]